MKKHYAALVKIEEAVHRHSVHALAPYSGEGGKRMDYAAAGNELVMLIESLKPDLPQQAALLLPQHAKRVRIILRRSKTTAPPADALRGLSNAVWDYLNDPTYEAYAR